jgi:phosphoribosylcarboxyaminoimidazole (NCAIR) mutase
VAQLIVSAHKTGQEATVEATRLRTLGYSVAVAGPGEFVLIRRSGADSEVIDEPQANAWFTVMATTGSLVQLP